MRKYQAIWITLKHKGEAKLEAAPDRHATIVQAVRKERTHDIPFRKAAKRLGKKYTVTHSVDETGYILTLTLTEVCKL